jgi:hypothetical protein
MPRHEVAGSFGGGGSERYDFAPGVKVSAMLGLV